MLLSISSGTIGGTAPFDLPMFIKLDKLDRSCSLSNYFQICNLARGSVVLAPAGRPTGFKCIWFWETEETGATEAKTPGTVCSKYSMKSELDQVVSAIHSFGGVLQSGH